MEKAGLLIQGPMISRGRTGADPFDPTVVEVNTVRDVQATIHEARAVGFDPIVLSTWAESPGTDEASRLQGLDRFLPLPDPLPCPAHEYQRYKDNRVRQAFGCLKGMRAVGEFPAVPFAARIRTDQTLDLKELFSAARSRNPGELGVIGLRRGRLAHLQDFLIAGTTADVVAHYEGQASCEFFPFHNDVHYDMFFKDAYGQLKDQVEAAAFLPRTYYMLDVQIPLFRHMFGRRLCPLPEPVARSVSWRGRPFTEEYFRTRMILSDEWQATARSDALSAIPARGIRLTALNRPYFVDVRRMIDLKLAAGSPPSGARERLGRLAGALRVKLLPAARWS